jgi:phage regulator Rha-like protein
MAKAQTQAPLPTIHTVRQQKVVLDSEVARLYGVATKALNQAVRRNRARFPEDFSFQLTVEEVAALRSQIVTAKGRGGRRTLPRVFTEHGALMAASILNSPKAVQMSIYLVRAFVEMREAMLTSSAILKRLAEIDRRLVEHDSVLREIIQRLQPLLDAPDPDDEEKPKIGFHPGNR